MSKTFQELTTEALIKYDRPIPRYTSYPTAVQFHEMTPEIYIKKLEKVQRALSLYIHIPFCEKMCLYCACSVVLNRKEDRKLAYLQALLQEIAMVGLQFDQKPQVEQLHFGGGTPTYLSCEELAFVLEACSQYFILSKEAEISIEIDPRTVILDHGEKLQRLKKIGFNRVSLGVQDTNEKVQIAIRRRQFYDMTKKTFQWAKEVGFRGINLDLIYGLPFQTIETFRDTISKIIEFRPDRVALFSYAKVPWLKPHQKAIKEKDLPSQQEKFSMYIMAREKFVNDGYVAIGMDHFSLQEDSLSKAYQNKTLIRNFQGYSVQKGEDLIGLGLSSIGFLKGLYVQNMKDLHQYQNEVSKQKLPVFKGYLLSKEDQIRKWVIHTLMCEFRLKKEVFFQVFQLDFDQMFSQEIQKLKTMEELVIVTKEEIFATKLGELLIRVIASLFDAYLGKSEQRFSRSI